MTRQEKVIAITGRRGSCKTLLAVHYCHGYSVAGRKVFSNIWLNFDYTPLTLDMIRELSPELKGSVVLIDEVQMWADAYKFFTKDSVALSTLATQLRKLGVTLIITVQDLRDTIIRLRRQVDFMIKMERASRIDGIAYATVLDATAAEGRDFIKQFIFDGRMYFDMYDTNEAVLPE